jgi:predicted hotdog family 3-hydroxylacyl-ACP dehydratase
MNREQITRLIPHAGAMCLLDGVSHWDTHGIHCHSRSHRDPNHPLRRKRRLSAVHLIEYAAQAAALHHGLIRQREAPSGVDEEPGGALVALHDIDCTVETLDAIAEPLQIHATSVLHTAFGLIYRFTVQAGGTTLSSGRITIVTE